MTTEEDYATAISLIRDINTLYSHERLVRSYEAMDIGKIVEEFSHLSEIRKGMVFEYLLFSTVGRMDK